MTSSDPPGLLAAVIAVNPYRADEMDYTYSVDPDDPTWLAIDVEPKPGITDIQGGRGFAHLVGSSWQIIGPGTIGVGCPVPDEPAPVLPTVVRKQFGLLPCPVVP
jgi:hypothetical protein